MDEAILDEAIQGVFIVVLIFVIAIAIVAGCSAILDEDYHVVCTDNSGTVIYDDLAENVYSSDGYVEIVDLTGVKYFIQGNCSREVLKGE